MDLKLRGKRAVVMSASAGIGRGIATVLAQEGCHLAICARGEERLQDVATGLRADHGVQVECQAVDVADAGSLDAFFDGAVARLGVPDILVNNSGGPPPGGCLALTDADYQSAFDLVFMSKVRATRAVVPGMVEIGGGCIISIESTGIKSAMENMVLSNAIRSASAAFSKTVSIEYGRQGIRSHTLMSGPFLTDRVGVLGKAAAERQGTSFDEWKRQAEASVPLGRFGDPLEFGALVAFLVSERAGYMNGACIAIDGGVLTTVS